MIALLVAGLLAGAAIFAPAAPWIPWPFVLAIRALMLVGASSIVVYLLREDK